MPLPATNPTQQTSTGLQQPQLTALLVDNHLLAPLQVSGMGAAQLAPGQERVPGLAWKAVGSVEDVLAVLEGGWVGG